jgi:hypothetical protein
MKGSDDMTMKYAATLALFALALASPAAAGHIFNRGPYDSRGECEARSAELSNEDRDQLLDRFPQLFSSEGEVASFLTRAFTCDLDVLDGKWYLIDRRIEVINSDWFQRRLP